jgi:hypothetical protein
MTTEIERVEFPPDCVEYRLNGLLHREDGPAIEWKSGSKEWLLNGKLHRISGPAREWVNGNKSWWLNGKLHRLDGPAIELNSGYNAWWLNDRKVSKEELDDFRCHLFLKALISNRRSYKFLRH